MKTKQTPIGAASTLSDLKVWVEETRPDRIYIPENHPLRSIREFNPAQTYTWDFFMGIPIDYEN